MTLVLVRCSIEADQQGAVSARARVSLVSWEWGSHAVLFMVPLSHSGARSMAQTLRLPFEYYYYLLLLLLLLLCIYMVYIYVSRFSSTLYKMSRYS